MEAPDSVAPSALQRSRRKATRSVLSRRWLSLGRARLPCAGRDRFARSGFCLGSRARSPAAAGRGPSRPRRSRTSARSTYPRRHSSASGLGSPLIRAPPGRHACSSRAPTTAARSRSRSSSHSAASGGRGNVRLIHPIVEPISASSATTPVRSLVYETSASTSSCRRGATSPNRVYVATLATG